MKRKKQDRFLSITTLILLAVAVFVGIIGAYFGGSVLGLGLKGYSGGFLLGSGLVFGAAIAIGFIEIDLF